MDLEARRHLERIFDELVETPEPQCQLRLAEIEQSQPEVARRLRRMIASDKQREATTSDRPLASIAHAVQASGPPSIEGYRILSPLGEGGFGIVYLAEQLGAVERRVAIKVIKPGMDSRAIVARFEAERQALAVMDNPGVAQVFGGGLTHSGHPYFVMELVRGEAITTYCDRHATPLQKRLELFIQVCDAVQHAHQKGIIHRDLKPSNVLVTVHHQGPVVKVIDFGVAKALDHKLSEKTILTEQGQIIGTPEYMSPEQAEMGALDIDTRSDVYSLGVLLYQLVSGCLPYAFDFRTPGDLSEIRQLICGVDPPRPSTRFNMLSRSNREASQASTSDGDEPETIARARGLDRPDLLRQLKGDLDWIAMKALEKDRTRRYETCNAFARDIRRYLDHEPVLAGPPTARYRARKFLRRNRTAVIIAASLMFLLIAGLAGTSIGLTSALIHSREAEAARDLAEVARQDADRQRAMAEQRAETIWALANSSVTELHAAVVGLPGAVEARRLILENGAQLLQDLEAQSLDSPALQADLASAYEFLGTTYADLRSGNAGDISRARDFQMKATELRTRLYESDQGNVDWSDALALSEIRLADLLMLEGHRIAARDRYTRAIQLLDPNDAPTLERLPQRAQMYASMRRIAVFEMNSGRFTSAREHIDRVNTLRRAGLEITTSPGVRRNASLAFVEIGQWHLEQGQFDDAITQFQTAINLQRGIVSDAPDRARYRRNLALSLSALSEAYFGVGHVQDSLAAANEACTIIEQIIEQESAFSDTQDVRLLAALAQALFRRGEAQLAHESHYPARDDFEEASQIARELVSQAPTNVEFQALNREAAGGLAMALLELGRSTEALQSAERALAISRSRAASDPAYIPAQQMVVVDAKLLGDAALAHAQSPNLGSDERTVLLVRASEAYAESDRMVNVLDRLNLLGWRSSRARADIEARRRILEQLR